MTGIPFRKEGEEVKEWIIVPDRRGVSYYPLRFDVFDVD